MTDSTTAMPEISEQTASTVPETPDAGETPSPAPSTKRAGFLSRFGIGTRIATIVAVPLLAAAGLAGQIVVGGLAELEDDRKIVNLTQISSTIGNAVHELQIERDLTSMFVATNGEEFADRLRAQRAKTDVFLKSLNERSAGVTADETSEQFASLLSGLPKNASGITAHRKKVDLLEMKPGK